ncbi:ArnT family glycosyltransferase [Kitasatospora gansuensis]
MPNAVSRPLAALTGRLPERVRTGYWTRVVPVLAVLATVTHLPSFLRPVWSPDEGYLATQARMLADGGVLYDTVVDRKPPLLPWLYEACFALFGSTSLWPLRTLAIVAHLATAILLASIARGRWGNRAGAVAAGSTCWSRSDCPPRTPRRRPSRSSCCPRWWRRSATPSAAAGWQPGSRWRSAH